MTIEQNPDQLPAPPVPETADLRQFQSMHLDLHWLRTSSFAVKSTGDGFKAALQLMGAAWHQVPAGSLPNDDELLASAAGFGVTKQGLSAWRKVSPEALRDWYKADDGRLYHPFLAKQVLTALDKKWKTEDYNQKHAERQRRYEGRKKAGQGSTASSVDSQVGATQSGGHRTDASGYDDPDAATDGQMTVRNRREKELIEKETKQAPAVVPFPVLIFPDDPPRRSSTRTYPPDFEALFDVHPKAVDKPASFEIYKALLAAEGPEMDEVVLAGAQRYRQECVRLGTEPAMIKGLKGWMQSRGWEDKGVTIATARSAGRRRTSGE